MQKRSCEVNVDDDNKKAENKKAVFPVNKESKIGVLYVLNIDKSGQYLLDRSYPTILTSAR